MRSALQGLPLTRALPAMALLASLTAPATAQRWPADESEEPREVIIRLLPPAPEGKGGKTRLEALLTEPDVHHVVFLVDDELVERRRTLPWAVSVELASPPREQIVRAEARDADDKVLASDEIVVNRRARPLRVSLRAVEPAAEGLLVRGELSLPDGAELERLEVLLNEEMQHSHDAEALSRGTAEGVTLDAGQLSVTLAAGTPRPQDFVRIVAHLVDGRSIEDVALVSGHDFTEQVDVHLVQLQVVVTNKRGLPMRGLQKQHFRITDRGGDRQPAGLFPADDVSLLLGLALDSSGSMQRIWPQTQAAAEIFLSETVRERDEGFLVDFDTRLHLVQERTADRQRLREALTELEPEGGTALYDSILFSLLQFDRQQGRRGLVVLTDGYDIDSQADPRRAVEFGRKLGVPIYILALESQRGGRVPARGITTGIGDPAAAVQELRLITDPTGGRLYRVGSPDQISRAFTLINAELRNQYVLTYTTDTPPEPGRPPKIRIDAPGHKGLEAKVVFGTDQIY